MTCLYITTFLITLKIPLLSWKEIEHGNLTDNCNFFNWAVILKRRYYPYPILEVAFRYAK